MAYQAGVAFVQVVPSLKGFNQAIGREVDAVAPAAGARAGKSMGAGMAGGLAASGSTVAAGASRAVSTAASATAAAGTTAGTGFVSRLGSSIAGGARAVGTAATGIAAGLTRNIATAGATAAAGFVGTMTRTLGPLMAVFAPAAILAKGFTRLANIEDAQAKLRGLGHTAEAVTKIMDNALASVKGTAFGLDEAATVASGLVAAGVKPGQDLERVLRLVADSATIAGSSMGEMGAIWNKAAATGKIQGDILAQLGDRGIPIVQLLGKQLGVTAEDVLDLSKKGKIGFADFAAAMEAGMSGAALKSGETVRGTLANVGAAMSRFGASLLAEVFPAIRSGGATVIEVFDRLGEKVPGFIAAVKSVAGPVLGAFTQFVRDNATWLKPLAVALGGAIAAFVALKIVLIPVGLAMMMVNAVMAANPFVQIVVLLGALVAAAIYCYNNFETFRNVVDKVWAGIKTATTVAWETVLRPVFNWIATFVTGTLAPTMLWLWNNVFVPAWNGIVAVVSFAWNYIIKPYLTALQWYLQNIVGPVVTWLWRNIFEPAFQGIWFAVQVAWNVIKLVFDLWVWYFRNVVAPVVTWLWQNIVQPVWNLISSFISWNWNNIIKPTLQALASFIGQYVAPAFQTGVNRIADIWNGLRAIAAAPVNFIIQTVYNSGIKRVFDQIAQAIGSSARLPLASPIGTGGPTSTSGRGPVVGVAARARGGWTPPGWTLVGEEGPELVDFRTPGRVYTAADTSKMIGDGPGDAFSAVGSILRDPLGAIGNAASNLLGRVPGAGLWVDLMKGVGGKIKDMVVQKVKDMLGDMAEGIIGQAGGGGGLGWQWMWNTVRAAFPGASLHSSFRPGSITATGNRSWHGRGRAIDVTPSMDIFNWIARNFGSKTLELIYSPAGGRQIYRGQPHMYTGVTRSMHFNHVHWAYDEGGWLPEGVRQVANRTGKPEAVLNPQQWDDIHALARRGATGGVQFNGPLQALDPRALAVEVERRIRQRQVLHAAVI